MNTEVKDGTYDTSDARAKVLVLVGFGAVGSPATINRILALLAPSRGRFDAGWREYL